MIDNDNIWIVVGHQSLWRETIGDLEVATDGNSDWHYRHNIIREELNFKRVETRDPEYNIK